MAEEIFEPIFQFQAKDRFRTSQLVTARPQDVQNILSGVQSGRLEDQERLFRLMFDSWSRLRGNMEKLGGEVSSLDVNVIPFSDEGSDPTPQDLNVASVVEDALWVAKSEPGHWEMDTRQLIETLVHAKVRGFAVLEIGWTVASSPRHNTIVAPRAYWPVPATHYAFPAANIEQVDRLMFSPEGLSQINLVDFEPNRFVVAMAMFSTDHPVYGAMLRSLGRYWIASHFGLPLLMKYAELFGVPWRTVTGDLSTADQSRAARALENLGSSGWAVLPRMANLNIHDSVKGGDQLPQKVAMDVADKACDILLLGQTLTQDVGQTGSRAVSETHERIQDQVFQGAACWVCRWLNSQLVPAIVAQNFGETIPTTRMPKIEIRIPEAIDEQAMAEKLRLARDINLPLSKSFVYETLGFPQPQDNEELFEWPSQAPPPQSPFGLPPGRQNGNGNGNGDEPLQLELDDPDDRMAESTVAVAGQSAGAKKKPSKSLYVYRGPSRRTSRR